MDLISWGIPNYIIGSKYRMFEVRQIKPRDFLPHSIYSIVLYNYPTFYNS